MITNAITAHNGTVTRVTTDEAYRFVTVAFTDHAARQAFLGALPGGTSWERGAEITVQLHLPLADPFEVPAAPVAPVPAVVAAPIKSVRSATTRGVCTADVVTARGTRECGAGAVATWDASYGGIVVEEGRCAQHNG